MSNYNFEENSNYTKNYMLALKQKEILTKKITRDDFNNITKPRKVGIKKDINYSVEGYQLWRKFDINFECPNTNGFNYEVTGKLTCSPKNMVGTFGFPTKPCTLAPGSMTTFWFQDINMDMFVIFDHTKDLDLRLRKNKGDFYEVIHEFIKEDKEVEFRFSGTKYCEKHRFKNYIELQLKTFREGKLDSFDERAIKLFGEIEMYNEYKQDYEMKLTPSVFKYQRKKLEGKFNKGLEFIDDKELDKEVKPSFCFIEEEGVKTV